MASPDPDDLHDVEAATQRWIQAFNAGDADRICALYHPEAVLWGTTARLLISTPQGMRDYFEGHCAAVPPPTIRLGTQRVRAYAGTAINSGSYTLHTLVEGQARALPARFSFTYCKVGSVWLIVDHHSSFVPT
ncbi:MAG: nuclear transport factor 2 family protein [Pseudomonadota bacterium]